MGREGWNRSVSRWFGTAPLSKKQMELQMEKKSDRPGNKGESGTAKKDQPGHVGGDQARKAEEWGGGTKASKGAVSKEDKRNPNSSAKS